ncbi:hypothetical protein ACOSQ3_032293 [Xanthoceras sorbifolium]
MDTENVVRLCEMLTINEEGVPEARMDPKIHELGMLRISLRLVVRLEDDGKSEERREVPITVEGPTSVKKRVMEEPILHLNSHDLLVGEKGGNNICEPDPIGNVVRALFGEETVMDSNSLCSEKDGLDQYSVCHKPDDGAEFSSTKGRKWKRMARSQGSKAGGRHNSSLKRKRELCFDFEDGQQIKKLRTEVNMSDTAAVAGNLMTLF